MWRHDRLNTRFPPGGDRGCAENRRHDKGGGGEAPHWGDQGRPRDLMGGDEKEPVMAKTKGPMVTGRGDGACRGPEVGLISAWAGI